MTVPYEVKIITYFLKPHQLCFENRPGRKGDGGKSAPDALASPTIMRSVDVAVGVIAAIAYGGARAISGEGQVYPGPIFRIHGEVGGFPTAIYPYHVPGMINAIR